jgi:hypothetical protein
MADGIHIDWMSCICIKIKSSEGPVRRPKPGGSEWESIKFFSKEMNSTMPQNHDQGFPHDLAKVTSHDGPTKPRNKPQLKPKWKRELRSEGLKQSARCRADRLRGSTGIRESEAKSNV